MNIIRKLTAVGALALFASTVACTNTRFGAPEGSSVLSSKGNGDSYAGKAYNFEISGLCPDQTHIASTLEISDDGSVTLTKDNCQPLAPPQPISAGDVVLLDGGVTLIFEDRIYTVDEVSDRLPTPIALCSDTSIHGAWEGTARNPWTLPYGVHLTFNPDGTYSAAGGITSMNSTTDKFLAAALYYGVDGAGPQKLFLVNPGASTGNIQIDFGFPGDTQMANLSDIRVENLDSDCHAPGKRHLRFTMVYRGYGPLTYELENLN